MLVVADHPDIHTTSEDNQKISRLNDKITSAQTYRSGLAAEKRMIRWHNIMSVPRCNNRNAQCIYALKKLLPRSCNINSGSRQDNRTFGLLYLLYDLCSLFCVIGNIFAPVGSISGKLICLYNRCLNIKRNIQPDRSLPAVLTQIPCLFQMIPYCILIGHHNRIFRHIPDAVGYLVLLVSKLAEWNIY